MSGFRQYQQTAPIAGIQLSDDSDDEDNEQHGRERLQEAVASPVSAVVHQQAFASPPPPSNTSSQNYPQQTMAASTFNGRRTNKKGEANEWVIEPVQDDDEEGMIVANAVQAVPPEPAPSPSTTKTNSSPTNGDENELPPELLQALAREGFDVGNIRKSSNTITDGASTSLPTPTVLGRAYASSAPPVVTGTPKPPPTVQGSQVLTPTNKCQSNNQSTSTLSVPSDVPYNSSSAPAPVPVPSQFLPPTHQNPAPPPTPAPSIFEPPPPSTLPTSPVTTATITSIKPPPAMNTHVTTSTATTTQNLPPGVPDGGRWVMVKKTGAVTWSICGVIGVVGCLFGAGILGLCGFWALLCPCDEKHAYMAPDGWMYDSYGRRIGHRDRSRWR